MNLSIDDSLYLQNTTDTTKVNSTLSKDYSTATEDELLDACKEFEAYFVEQMFKAMEKTVMKDEDEDSGVNVMDYFGDTFYQEIAEKATSEGEGMGIAQMLYEQMKRNYNIE